MSPSAEASFTGISLFAKDERYSLPSLTVTGHFPSPLVPANILAAAGNPTDIGLPARFLHIFSGVSQDISFPPSITATLSAIGNTSSRRCSAIITVVPSSRFIFRKTFINPVAAMGSSCDVGSSKSKSFGESVITDASASSCCCPPERVAVSLRNQVFIPK